MKYKYVVILKQGNHRAIDILSILLCVSSSAVFIHAALKTGLVRDYIFYALAAILVAGLIYNAFVRRRQPKPVSYRFLLGFAAVGWMAMPYLEWIGLIFAFLILLESQAKRAIEIGFDLDSIVINTLFKRRILWSDLQNAVLRDGLLTLDFKNNRLIQREIADDDDEDDADEEEFNAFCRERLDPPRESDSRKGGKLTG
jgi:hypothetical protein